jgi:hypothetical protein
MDVAGDCPGGCDAAPVSGIRPGDVLTVITQTQKQSTVPAISSVRLIAALVSKKA